MAMRLFSQSMSSNVEVADLSAAQAEPSQQQQDGVIPPPDGGGALAGLGQDLLDLSRVAWTLGSVERDQLATDGTHAARSNVIAPR